MLDRHHRSLRHLRMANKSALHLCRAHAVPADVDDIVYTACDPVVAILVTAAAISGEVVPIVVLEVRDLKSRVVACNGTHDAWPRALDDEETGALAVQLRAFLIDDSRLHSEEGQRRRARPHGEGPWQVGDHVGARLCLPPGVDNRAAAVPDHLIVPLPGRRVDGLAHSAQQAQALARMLSDQIPWAAHQRADGGGRGVED
mmetsp:Transcript_25906/g.66666  ORF Transcript_25906/g.66666 Transcript_25906/m.66666 type:complete len:201 (+) Transcript_25906:551-1153(+)